MSESNVILSEKDIKRLNFFLKQKYTLFGVYEVHELDDLEKQEEISAWISHICELDYVIGMNGPDIFINPLLEEDETVIGYFLEFAEWYRMALVKYKQMDLPFPIMYEAQALYVKIIKHKGFIKSGEPSQGEIQDYSRGTIDETFLFLRWDRLNQRYLSEHEGVDEDGIMQFRNYFKDIDQVLRPFLVYTYPEVKKYVTIIDGHRWFDRYFQIWIRQLYEGKANEDILYQEMCQLYDILMDGRIKPVDLTEQLNAIVSDHSLLCKEWIMSSVNNLILSPIGNTIDFSKRNRPQQSNILSDSSSYSFWADEYAQRYGQEAFIKACEAILQSKGLLCDYIQHIPNSVGNFAVFNIEATETTIIIVFQNKLHEKGDDDQSGYDVAYSDEWRTAEDSATIPTLEFVTKLRPDYDPFSVSNPYSDVSLVSAFTVLQFQHILQKEIDFVFVNDYTDADYAEHFIVNQDWYEFSPDNRPLESDMDNIYHCETFTSYYNKKLHEWLEYYGDPGLVNGVTISFSTFVQYFEKYGIEQTTVSDFYEKIISGFLSYRSSKEYPEKILAEKKEMLLESILYASNYYAQTRYLINDMYFGVEKYNKRRTRWIKESLPARNSALKQIFLKLEKRANDNIGNLYEENFLNTILPAEIFLGRQMSIPGVDNTAVCVGYMKSVEILLANILVKDYKNEVMTINPRKAFNINEENRKNMTLGSIQYFISHSACLSSEVQEYKDDLCEKLDFWRKSIRNGYLHKDVLGRSQIDEIRFSTFEIIYYIIAVLPRGTQ